MQWVEKQPFGCLVCRSCCVLPRGDYGDSCLTRASAFISAIPRFIMYLLRTTRSSGQIGGHIKSLSERDEIGWASPLVSVEEKM